MGTPGHSFLGWGEGLTEPGGVWVLPDAWRDHTGSGQVVPEQAAWLGGGGGTLQVLHPAGLWELLRPE